MIIDTNIYVSRWPCRRLPHDTTDALVRKLRERGIEQAWAGSFDCLLHKDLSDVNSRLVADCKQNGDGLLVPVGSVNPILPDWQEDLRRCQDVHGMRIIRIHPNYHGYRLDSELCNELFEAVQKRGMVLQLVLAMEDVRVQHPLMQVPVVDTAPLESLVKKFPQLPLVIMNNSAGVRAGQAAELAKAANVFFEISHFESVGALENWVKDAPLERILFGSYFPFFNLEAAILKFQESHVGGLATLAIQSGNAQKLLRANS